MRSMRKMNMQQASSEGANSSEDFGSDVQEIELDSAGSDEK
jgi:hypothetical protein